MKFECSEASINTVITACQCQVAVKCGDSMSWRMGGGGGVGVA